MKYTAAIFALLLFHFSHAQNSFHLNPFKAKNEQEKRSPRKLLQKNHGAIVGLQKGSGTALELGYEAHWRKWSLFNPTISGATANLEYDIARHLVAYKAGMWMKKGRVNLTYGANLVYFNDFNGQQKYGVGPAVGFRLAGFHFVNGYNILAGDQDLKVNTLFVSLRYFFPVENKFTWDRQTLKRKEERRKERAARKQEKEQERAGKTGIKKLLNL